jgi:hypothetical protein
MCRSSTTSLNEAREHGRLRFDAGQGRHKHCGRAETAEVVLEHGAYVGKCPRNLGAGQAEAMLNSAIPEYRKTLPDRPCAYWNVLDGVVYKANTSDHGTSWHGYPVKHGIPRRIERQLRERAEREDCVRELDQWLGR